VELRVFSHIKSQQETTWNPPGGGIEFIRGVFSWSVISRRRRNIEKYSRGGAPPSASQTTRLKNEAQISASYTRCPKKVDQQHMASGVVKFHTNFTILSLLQSGMSRGVIILLFYYEIAHKIQHKNRKNIVQIHELQLHYSY